eukprot:TRINITY_DN33394_c0_g2_i1.p1 TRINITY_DN33394_c0_g2~~TRINITY_DN33394_c0_g2_i1.p1  ORF type:complete len:185 (+),score=38.48 TRINITY_DN33394_c0_g2_i1:51-605(+)
MASGATSSFPDQASTASASQPPLRRSSGHLQETRPARGSSGRTQWERGLAAFGGLHYLQGFVRDRDDGDRMPPRPKKNKRTEPKVEDDTKKDEKAKQEEEVKEEGRDRGTSEWEWDSQAEREAAGYPPQRYLWVLNCPHTVATNSQRAAQTDGLRRWKSQVLQPTSQAAGTAASGGVFKAEPVV